MTSLKRIFSFLANPVFWLGAGLGSVAGVAGAAGFSMTSADAARFVGAVIGALIAVAGAVSLHFLKERTEVERKRQHILSSIEQLQKFSVGLLASIEAANGNEISSGLRVTQRFLNRCKRYCETFGTDDLRISVIGGLLENVKDDSLTDMVDSDNNYEDTDEMSQFIGALTGSFALAHTFLKTGEMK